MSEELNALADRCEQATGPDRELDGEIAKALSPDLDWHRFEDTWGSRDPKDGSAFNMPEAFTASLDAALTLVPEGVGINIDRYWIASVDGPVWATKIAMGGVPNDPRRVFECYDAFTPALALTAAALRARQALAHQ